MPENKDEMTGAHAPGFFGAVYLILQRHGEILMIKRSKTIWAGGYWSLPSGHIEGEETVFEALRRETLEETGVALRESDVTLLHVMHRLSEPPRVYFDFFFMAEHRGGEVKNLEPDKHDEVRWFPEDNLPKDTLPYIARTLAKIRHGLLFSEEDSSEIR